MTESKTADLIRDLNKFGEERFREGSFKEAEDRFRTALDVYRNARNGGGGRHIEILSTITGLVRSLESQGKDAEAALVLRQEYETVTDIIDMLQNRS